MKCRISFQFHFHLCFSPHLHSVLADYAFLAGLAYRSPNNTQEDLDGWFGPGIAFDDIGTVEEYRSNFNVTSAVSFKLVTFPNSGNFAYVLIRGTTNNWDMLTDAQLWSAAALLQVHRELLPIGVAWTPILDQLIRVITKIESASIESVSFYKDTTAFVNFLKNQSDAYLGVGVTGHSLGGGLSIITGAQTGVPAVALSGPNAMLSRRSFDPPISAEDLDSKTFVCLLLCCDSTVVCFVCLFVCSCVNRNVHSLTCLCYILTLSE
jgi:lipase ATG15